jgi:ABC-2 type transport system ATP-binding protein
MLKVQNLHKKFNDFVAVQNVSFEVKNGEVFGLLGPNGAGKTTTIRMIMNIIKPDSGKVTFYSSKGEEIPFSEELKNIIGYLPEERGLYRKNKVINTILYFTELKNVGQDIGYNKAYELLERFDLKDFAEKKCEELSKGMQQKVQFIISIIHDPEIMILDEPFSGLDPVNQIVLKDVLGELKQKGKAIIFSTHQMETVEKLCDNICLINHGNIVLQGGLNEVKRRYGTDTIHIEYEGDGSFLKTMSEIKKAEIFQNYAEIQLVDHKNHNDFLLEIAKKLQIRKFELMEPSLHSIFVSIVGK